MQWLQVSQGAHRPLHAGSSAAAWVPSEVCTGGMGGSGGWPARCGVIALHVWRTVPDAEIRERGVCPECLAALVTGHV